MSPTELDSNALDIRRTSITQLDRNLGECDVLEMPAPPRVDLSARYDAAYWNSRTPATLGRAGGGDLIRGCERHAKRFAANSQCDQCAR